MIALSFLGILGYMALFVYAIRLMSFSVQRISGEKMCRFLLTFTPNRHVGVLSGMGVTTLVQSSSAVSVMMVSFVGSGMLSLQRALPVVIGANVGITIVGWLVASLHFSFDYYNICYVFFLLAVPLQFHKKASYRYLSHFIASFSLILLSFLLIKNELESLFNDMSLISNIKQRSELDFKNALFFLTLGLMLSALVSYHLVSFSFTMLLMTNGLPEILALIMLIGINLGTSFSAFFASALTNRKGKAVALFHFLFNVFSSCWALLFLPGILDFLNRAFSPLPIYMLAAFDTGVAIITAIPFLLLLPYFTRFMHNRQNLKGVFTDKKNPSLTSLEKVKVPGILGDEIYIEVLIRKRFMKMTTIIRQTTTNLGRLLIETDSEKFHLVISRITELKIREETMANELTEYLKNLDVEEMSGRLLNTLTSSLSITNYLEGISHACIRIARAHELRRSNGSYLTPKLRVYLIKYQELLEKTIGDLVQHLSSFTSINKQEVDFLHSEEKKISHKATMALQESLQNGEVKYISVIYYKDLLTGYELIFEKFSSIYRVFSNL